MSGKLSEGALDFFNGSAWVGIALSILAAILTETANWYFDLGLHPEVAILVMTLTALWSLPMFLYLLYHRVTLPLPTWLTCGHPVAFGGAASNVCADPSVALGLNGNGGWPCFPSELKTWLAKVAGPQGWSYLLQPDTKLILCLIFLALNIGIIVILIHLLRKPRFDAGQQDEEMCKSRRD